MNQSSNNHLDIGNNSRDDYQLTFQDYVVIIRIHFKLIIFMTLLGLLISTYMTYSIPLSFQATATVEIRERPGANMVMDFSGNTNKNRLVNEIQVIMSRSLAKEVVKDLWDSERRNNLHIFGTRKFYPKGHNFRNMLKTLVSLGMYDFNLDIPKKYKENYNESIGEQFAGNIISNLNVNNIRNTNIIKISFSSPNADEARRIANIIAETYIKYDSERSKKNAHKTVEFLDSLVFHQQIEIEENEKKIRDFKLKNNMYSLDGDASSIIPQLNLYESELYDIKSQINIRKEKVEILNSKLTIEEKTLTSQLTNDLNYQLNSIRIDIGRLESQIVQNSNTYGPNHSVVAELKNKLNNLKNELDEKVDLFIAQGIKVQDPLVAIQDMVTELLNLDSEIISYELRQSEVKKMLTFFNTKLNGLPKKQMELARLNRDVEVLNQNYLFLRQRLEEAKVNVAVQVGNAIMLDQARAPKSPIGPNHKRNILLGLVLGLGTGLIITFLIEFLDNTLKTIDEIEKYQLSVLGIIPAIGKEITKRGQYSILSKLGSGNNQPNSRLKRRLITREDPKSPISEAYRSLRTNMLYSSQDKIKSILVSSAGPGEGKTTTVANLAITYANLGKRTLLVDTDLRRPVVHKVFDKEREPGVTNYLSGQTEDIKSLIKSTEINNLYIITSGIIPPNPSEMLGSTRMTDLVRLLEEDWDMILFDSPPLVAVTDANMISKEIDKIVLVVKVGQTDKKAFHHTFANLKHIDAPLGGIIMNAVTNKSSYGSYYYYYYQQYYHYYGSDKE